MTEDEKDLYQWTEKPKFKSTKGKKSLCHAFNKRGMRYFSKYWKALRHLADDRTKWEALNEAFVDYVARTKLHQHYQLFKQRNADHLHDDQSDDEDLDLPSAMPGMSTFVRDGSGRGRLPA